MLAHGPHTETQMTNKSISVLTTLYNHADFIQATLASALRQTLAPDEIIVIDDASTDRSVKAAAEVTHPSIHLYAETVNLGGPNTMKGLSLCRGELIAILNSDDTWHDDKLRRQAAHLDEHPGCGAVFTHVRVMDEHGEPWKEGTSRHQSVFQVANRDRHKWLRHLFLKGNAFCASSALVRRECFDKLGPLDGRYAQLQDFDMWLRVLIAGYDVHVVQEKLTNYRVMRNGSNMSAGKPAARALYAFEYAKILRHFWQIESLEELSTIFPELPISRDANDSLILFYLAMLASRQPSIHHRLFALETMSQWGGNLEAMHLAHQCHGFTHAKYRDFLAAGPIAEMLERSLRGRIQAMASRVLPFHLQQRLKAYLLGGDG